MTFPSLIYKSPGGYRYPKSKLTYSVASVQDEHELAGRLAAGWFQTKEEAVGLVTAPVVEVVEVVEVAETPKAEDYEPSRAELEQKATEMGIKFDGRTSDKKLLKLITEGLQNELD
jgi:hypothetical protein